jgi:hypothetical protein
MKFKIGFFILIFVVSNALYSQMVKHNQVYYGNEWIDYNKTYFKIKVAENGIYRISYERLLASGVIESDGDASRLQLFSNGEELPLFISNEASMESGDYVEFYGKKNILALDTFLFEDWQSTMKNTEYSFFNDSTAYFITNAPEAYSPLRYQTTIKDFSQTAPNPEPYYLHRELVLFTNFYYQPTFVGSVRFSHFSSSEGWSRGLRRDGDNNISTSQRNMNAGVDATLRFRVGSNGIGNNAKDFFFNGEFLLTDVSGPNGVFEKSVSIPLDKLQNTNRLRVENKGQDDRHSVAFVELVYPRNFHFGNQNKREFRVSGGEKYFEILSFNRGDLPPVAYDPLSAKRYIGGLGNSGRTLLWLDNDGPEDRNIMLISSADGYFEVDRLEQIEFTDLRQVNPDYLFLTGKSMYASEGSEFDAISAYMDYRASSDGGSYNPYLLFAEEIYNQFGYGIDRHLHSFKNFNAYIRNYWTDLKFIFIVGKGREYHMIRTNPQLSASQNQSFYVPTYGDAPSDHMLFSEGNSFLPLAPVGRLAARHMRDVSNYLDKVREHDRAVNTPQDLDKMWTKRFMHLGGGADTNERNSIRNFLNQMKQTVESGKIGADVISFYKSSTEPIQQADAREIFNTINSGLKILTFFGHSSVGTFDFSLENPSEYSNQGRLPIIISLGCFSGNIFTPAQGTSDQFVMEKDKGAIGFLAASGSASLPNQGVFGGNLYHRMSNEFYGSAIGEVIYRILEENKDATGLSNTSLFQQLVFHGDPALRLFAYEKPDYTFDFGSVKTQPEMINAADNQYEIKFDVINLGRKPIDSLTIEAININLSNDIQDTFYLKIEAPGSKSTHSIIIQNDNARKSGNNRLLMRIDVENLLDEGPLPAARQNNELIAQDGRAGFEYFVFDNAVRPLYPREFAIHNQDTFTLIAAANNGFAAMEKFVLQIDTTTHFNSSLLQSIEVESFGGHIEWTPGIQKIPGKVYYWRVRPSLNPGGAEELWQGSSFLYQPGDKPGWNQSHYFQFLRNDLAKMELSESRRWEFGEDGFTSRLFNGIWDGGINVGYIFNFDGFAQVIKPWPLIEQGIAISIGDAVNGRFRENFGGDNGSLNSTNNGTRGVFIYDPRNEEQRLAAMNFLESINDGEYVYFWTLLRSANADFQPLDWIQDSVTVGKSLYTILKDNGAVLADELRTRGSVPYTIIYRKGHGVLGENIAEDKFGNILTNVYIPSKAEEGYLNSYLVGPASEWYSAEFGFSPLNMPDSISFSVLGISRENQQEVFIAESSGENIDLSNINALEFPYLKLRYFAANNDTRIPVQLNNWKVYYRGLPDVAFNANLTFEVKDSVQQGETYVLNTKIANLENYDMDSLLVKYIITDDRNNRTEQLLRIQPIAGGEIVPLRFEDNTVNKSGNYRLEVQLNPDEDQRESVLFNNQAFLSYNVFPDKTAPLLNVTFDGTPIMDGDIISPRPFIVISLKDENPYLLLDNPETLRVKMISSGGTERTFMQGDGVFNFIPASNEDKNEAKIELTPELEDGEYRLIVEARDRTGNVTGQQHFEVNFEVISQEAISNVMNFPNPFSTSTQFVFTITGSVPENMLIRIMTITGKVVKEITQDQLGPLRVGRNLTDYRWDGRDEFGDPLGNGVYLYQVIARDQSGSLFEKRENQRIDSYFTKGFGKMVIMR